MANEENPNTNKDQKDNCRDHQGARNPKTGANKKNNAGDTSSGMSRTKKALVVGGFGMVAVTLAPVALTTLGFGAAGITAGSTAASMMSIATTCGYGLGVVSSLQSAGAAGFALAAKGWILAGGAAVGKGIVAVVDANVANKDNKSNQEAKLCDVVNTKGNEAGLTTPNVRSTVSNGWGEIVTNGIGKILAAQNVLVYGLAAKAWSDAVGSYAGRVIRDETATINDLKLTPGSGATDVKTMRIKTAIGHGSDEIAAENAPYVTWRDCVINGVGVVSAIQSVGLTAVAWIGAGAVGGGIVAAMNKKAVMIKKKY